MATSFVTRRSSRFKKAAYSYGEMPTVHVSLFADERLER